MEKETLKTTMLVVNNIISRMINEKTVNCNQLADLRQACFDIYGIISDIFNDRKVELL